MSPTSRTPLTPYDVLLVDDSAGDVRLTGEAIKEARIRLHLHVAEDGAEAMSFLRRKGKHAGCPRPDLVLLDLNLPRKSGREVLEEMKADLELKCLPVIILTTSSSEEDVRRCYQLHANCYISKPIDLDGFLKVVKSIDTFWLTTVKLPPVEVRP